MVGVHEMKRFINAIASGLFVGGLAVGALLVLKFAGEAWCCWYVILILFLFIIQMIIGKVVRK